MTTAKKGVCVNPSCSKQGQEFLTHHKKFYCPVCKQPLQDPKKKKQKSSSESSDSSFPWTGIFILVLVGLFALGAYWVYIEYFKPDSMARIEKERNKEFHFENVIKSNPEKQTIQNELNNFISSTVSDRERDSLVQYLSSKYFSNTFVVHIDSTMEVEASREKLKDYLEYLAVFAEDGPVLKVEWVNVDSVETESKGAVIYVTEKLSPRKK